MTDRKTLFVDVILPVPIFQEFTYRVPFEMNDAIRTGMRVIVPFGKAKLHTAIVTRIHEEIPEMQTRYVEYLLDEAPIITANQYAFWKWIARYYMAPIGDVMNAALPANFKLASETKVVMHPDYNGDRKLFNDRENQLIDILEIREELTLKELAEILGIKTIQPVVKGLIDKRAVITLEELNNKYTPKTETFVGINPVFTEDEINAIFVNLEQSAAKAKQLDALLILLRETQERQQDFVPKKRLLEAGVSASSLSTLEKNGYILIQKMEVSRLEENSSAQQELKELSPEQQTAYEEIKTSFEQQFVTLLHGVTGSGKTEIYVKLIQEQLEQGNQVLFLLPEIALTTQLIQRLSKYFGDWVGVYHSKFNQNERIEIWNHVLNNDPNRFRIILGARSSVFLPFQQLGLIIVDEEHESSFKQYDPSPRYNARDAALVLARLHDAKVLLGSATPAMETYYNATHGKYGLVELNQRFGGMQLPEILCADLRKERRQQSMQSDFSSFLINEMREALNRKEQIILFQNRRGYTPLWMCEICNWTPKCVNCDVSLTYHKQTNTLKCHYCSYVRPPMGSCSACGSNRIRMIGFGTEKIEDDLGAIFPNAVVQRLDLDTTRSKYAYETILNDFEARQIDILIGTQMVSKGLDFDNVSLVGILDADMLLNRADFRAFERGFQLMSQVAGRAGRKHKRGKVIIQTGDVDHWVIQKVHEHDYKGFYKSELIERKNYFYPPFFKVINITLKHKDHVLLDNASLQLAQALRGVFKERVLGPEYPVIRRIQNLFLKQIKLKVERDLSDTQLKERLQELINSFYSAPSNKSIRVIVDVDPA